MQQEANQVGILTASNLRNIPTGTPVYVVVEDENNAPQELTGGMIFQGQDEDNDPWTFVLHNNNSKWLDNVNDDRNDDGDYGDVPSYMSHLTKTVLLSNYSDDSDTTNWAEERNVLHFAKKTAAPANPEKRIEVKLTSDKPRKATLDGYIAEAKAKGVTTLVFNFPDGKSQEVDLTEEIKPKYFNNPILSTFQENDIKAVELAMDMNLPTLLIGHTGLGKTTLVKALSEAHGKDLIRFSVHSGITADEIIGKWLAKGGETVWQDGVLTKAMKDGKHFVMDEINACPADVLFQLHALLDDDRHIIMSEKDGTILRPHSDFRFFGTMNPQDEYAGTKELNMAFLSRFTSVVTIQPFQPDIEVGILERKGVTKATATDLVRIANNLRDWQERQDIRFFCGTRDIINTGLLIEKGLDRNVAITVGLLNKMDKDDADYVKKSLGTSFEAQKTAQEKEIEQLNNTIAKANKEKTEAHTATASALSELQKVQQELDTLKQQGVGGANIDETTKKALRILGKTI